MKFKLISTFSVASCADALSLSRKNSSPTNVCLNEQPLLFAVIDKSQLVYHFWKAGPPVDRCEQSDECLRKLLNYGVNMHHRKAILQFVRKKSNVFVNLPIGYGKSNGDFKGRDSLHELSSETRSEY